MRRLTIALMIVALVGAGCSDKKSDSKGDTTPTTSDNAGAPVKLEGDVTIKGSAEVTGGEIEIEADDLYFKPTFIKTDGKAVKVSLKNEGSASHTFTIDALSIDEELAPGAEKTVSVTIPSGAPTEFYCRFHKGSGMRGAFYVA